MECQLERMLAAYCAPTLAGIKTASLVACSRTRFPDLPLQIARYQTAFAPRGLEFSVICVCRERFLLLVYHRQRLEKQLSDEQAVRLLKAFDYPMEQGVDALLHHLEHRIKCGGSFPHEIGLFLGYPIEDVIGFIRNAGQGSKLTGYWKVYGDVEAASKCFDSFRRVKRAVTDRVERGESLLHVFAVAS